MKVEGTIKPQEIEITETMVFINSNIQEIERKTTENEDVNVFYVWDQEAYTKDQYIFLLQERTVMVEDALQDLIIDLEG